MGGLSRIDICASDLNLNCV